MANNENTPGKGGAMDYHEYKRMLEARRKQTWIANRLAQSPDAPNQVDPGLSPSEEPADVVNDIPQYDAVAEQTPDGTVDDTEIYSDSAAESGDAVQPRVRKRPMPEQSGANGKAVARENGRDAASGTEQTRVRRPDEGAKNVQRKPSAPSNVGGAPKSKKVAPKSVVNARNADKPAPVVRKGSFLASLLSPHANERGFDYDEFYDLDDVVDGAAKKRAAKASQARPSKAVEPGANRPAVDDQLYAADDVAIDSGASRRKSAPRNGEVRPAHKKTTPVSGKPTDRPAAKKPRPDAGRTVSGKPAAKKPAARDSRDSNAGFDPIMSGYERANAELRHPGKRKQEEVDPLKLEAERRRRKQEELKRQLELEDELLQYEVSTDNSDVAPEVLKPYEDRYDDEDGDNAEWNSGIKRALKKSKSGIAALASKARVGKSKSELYQDLESAFDEVAAEANASREPVMAGFAVPVTETTAPRSTGGRHGGAAAGSISANDGIDARLAGYAPETGASPDGVPLRRRRHVTPAYDEYDAYAPVNDVTPETEPSKPVAPSEIDEDALLGVSPDDNGDIVVNSRRGGHVELSDESEGADARYAIDAVSEPVANEPETRAGRRSKARAALANPDYSIFMPPAEQSSEKQDETSVNATEKPADSAVSTSAKKGIKYILTKARSRKYDLSDIEPEDDDVQIYKPSNLASADIPEIPTPYDDDDELDDKTNVTPRSRAHSSVSPSKGDVRLADLPGDPALTDESLSDDDYDETAHGGCLRNVLILVGIMAVLCALIWGLNHFGVIRVNDVTDKVREMFNPSKQEAVVEPVEIHATPAAEATDAVAPTSTDAAATEATGAAIEGASNVPDATSAADQSTGVSGTTALAEGVAPGDMQGAASTSDAPAPSPAPTPAPSAIPEHTASPVNSEALPKAEGLDVEFGIYDDYTKNNDYVRAEKISFGQGSDYTDLEGVITFRGNNYRDTASYGTASLTEKDFKIVWTKEIGAIDSGYAVWTGVGWNGQPVMVRWSDELRNMMNLYDEKKAKSGLVEVIYGALDGYIYFLDAEDGTRTRDAIKLGFPIKGSVSIDPRGYPLLYVGQGISLADGVRGKIGWRVYNLLNQEHMYLLNGHDDLRFRTHGSFDGVCLVNADTDTVIEGAENGIFYTIKLNTEFDPTVPSISIDPKVVLYRYKSHGYNKDGSEALGIENSVAAYGPYAFFADNSGLFTCLDLNNMNPVWCADVSDDTDSSTVLEVEPDGEVALYTASEVDKQGSSGNAYMRKFNAMTGALIWEHSVKCETDGTNGGGAFATPALGKNSLSRLVYFTMARTDEGGTIFAYDKDTGEVIWQKSTKRFAWSSPVLVYNDEGYGVVLQANSKGTLYMYDGLTGETLSSIELGSNVEGSPAVVDDMLVVGTRGQQIIGVKIL